MMSNPQQHNERITYCVDLIERLPVNNRSFDILSRLFRPLQLTGPHSQVFYILLLYVVSQPVCVLLPYNIMISSATESIFSRYIWVKQTASFQTDANFRKK